MTRYLFRVQYTKPDGSVTYEPVCIRAETEAVARVELDDATERYAKFVNASRTYTISSTTVEP